MAEDVSRGLTRFGADAAASRTGFCNLSTNGSQVPLDRVNEVGAYSSKEVEETTHSHIWEDAKTHEFQA